MAERGRGGKGKRAPKFAMLAHIDRGAGGRS
jgi:hypothetical protein